MIVGGYVLDIYCDNEDCPHGSYWWPRHYTGEFGSTCRKRARRDGWLLNAGRTLCPNCKKAARSKT